MECLDGQKNNLPRKPIHLVQNQTSVKFKKKSLNIHLKCKFFQLMRILLITLALSEY